MRRRHVVLLVPALWSATAMTAGVSSAAAAAVGCSDFAGQAAAQLHLDAHPDAAATLDPDRNGFACDSVAPDVAGRGAPPVVTRPQPVVQGDAPGSDTGTPPAAGVSAGAGGAAGGEPSLAALGLTGPLLVAAGVVLIWRRPASPGRHERTRSAPPRHAR